ncbi:MAG: carboxypeptidase-like regulatory domain-containing protein [Planctomycetes bacterium]|jgi:hypothetical protein|nr:carboxypeptidase-like regulatory domain-containing protein [Planctomycetota bacterium]
MVSLLLLAAPLAAQHRAPFSGVVRDPAGAAIAGAQVVCSWSPDGSSLARAEQHSMTTDASGRFALDLAVGRAYCVWAIGPADADERRRVVPPAFTAVGGRTLDLVADRSMAPVQLQVTGASAWRQVGPLALRIVVAGQAALPDFVIAGDGIVKLPPLPTPLLTVCLLDFRRAVLDSAEIDAEGLTPCAFAPVGKADFVVVDADDRPVAGASIVAPNGFLARHRMRFNPYGGHAGVWREIAVTDAKGRASGLVRGDSIFVARHDGAYSSGLSGTMHGERIENGSLHSVETDGPYWLRLGPPRPVRVPCAGVGADVVLHGMSRSVLSYRSSDRSGGMPCQVPLARDGDCWVGATPGNPHVSLLGEGTGSRPLRVMAWTQHDPIDLATLRHLDVQVNGADGRPAPFAAVGISHGLRGFPVRWTTHLVGDADGRAELRVMPGDCELYAVTEDAHGYIAIRDAGETTATITMQPFAMVRLRIVDQEGRPVTGAHVQMTGGSVPKDGIGRITHPGIVDAFSGLTSDADGLIVARVPPELAGKSFRALWRSAQSIEQRLEIDRPEPIELRLQR